MSLANPECDELRVSIERLRAMLEALIVRGLRACGADELAQLRLFTDDLDKAGAGHVASILTTLQQQIESNDRAAAKTLLTAQTSVRLLERLLTLRVVKSAYELSAVMAAAGETGDDGDLDEDGDDAEEDEPVAKTAKKKRK